MGKGFCWSAGLLGGGTSPPRIGARKGCFWVGGFGWVGWIGWTPCGGVGSAFDRLDRREGG